MYYNNQTLYHKDTHEIVALHPQGYSQFNWELNSMDGKTCLIRENGEIFLDDINKYTHFEDFFGRPATYTTEKSESAFVDTSLRKYLVFGEERERLRKKALEDWYEKILLELDSVDYVHCPFSDGSYCRAVADYFKEKTGAVIFYHRVSGPELYKCNEWTFSRNGKLYLIRNDEIVQITV